MSRGPEPASYPTKTILIFRSWLISRNAPGDNVESVGGDAAFREAPCTANSKKPSAEQNKRMGTGLVHFALLPFVMIFLLGAGWPAIEVIGKWQEKTTRRLAVELPCVTNAARV